MEPHPEPPSAEERAKAKLGLIHHTVVYVIVIGTLAMVNLATSRHVLWFLWPAVGWESLLPCTQSACSCCRRAPGSTAGCSSARSAATPESAGTGRRIVRAPRRVFAGGDVWCRARANDWT